MHPDEQFDNVPTVEKPKKRKLNKLERKLVEAIKSLIRNHEYQQLHGWPHFTSASTEMEWKAGSAKAAWSLASEALKMAEEKANELCITTQV